jgi:hypothetical protein
MYKKKKEGLHLEDYATDEDLEYCAKLYREKTPQHFIPTSVVNSVIELRNGIALGGLFKLIMYDEAIIGFIAAQILRLPHTADKCVQQNYYMCNAEGMVAARALLMSHDLLINFAEGNKVKYVVSQCSPFEKNDNLCRLLKTQGWDTIGYVAVWKTSHEKQPSSKQRSPRQSADE